jgi:transcriptional regulator with XRE-family HTH domain
MKFRVRKLAEEQGLDAAKLSRRADLNYNTVSVFWGDEEDNSPNPRAKTLAAIAKALGVPVRDLIAEEGDEDGIRAPEYLVLVPA